MVSQQKTTDDKFFSPTHTYTQLKDVETGLMHAEKLMKAAGSDKDERSTFMLINLHVLSA